MASLSPSELQALVDEMAADPDDVHIPASVRYTLFIVLLLQKYRTAYVCVCVCIKESCFTVQVVFCSESSNRPCEDFSSGACELPPPPKKKECFSCPSVWYQPTMSYYKNI